MAGSGHHSPVSLYALIQAAAVLRSHDRRLAASAVLTPSNKTQETTSIRAVSSNMMRESEGKLVNVQQGMQHVSRDPSLDLAVC